ncbi:MAG: hypothetical protein QOE69_368, partial [Thermoleophilaceae bacterium]|nr:hypothetical protein [Thermoleophilaceae bacterium]
RALAEAFGARSADALALVQGNVGIQLPLADIFAALPSHAALIVHDAHLLTDEAWAGRALWALRARMQRPDPPGLVLLSRPWHTEPLVGLDGPFFGFARLIGLPIPSADDWAMATDYTIKPEALNWLLRQTRGVPRTTLAVLEQLPPSDREERTQAELEAAWLAHARDAGEAAAAVRGLVRGLHRFAPRLLRAIAAGEPVYPSVPGARPDAIAKALGRMRDHDVIYQPGPRRWLVADPALVPHLASGRAR